MNSTVIDGIEKYKIIPVVKIDTAGNVVELCRALEEGGLPVVEITFRSACAIDAMKLAVHEFPDFIIGAGTVITLDELDKARDAGAKFAVSPGLSRRLVEKADAMSFPYFPGVATPTEVQTAYELGCRVMKFFPAGELGGVKMIKAIYAPLSHLGIRFIPTGGVNADNMMEYLKEPSVLAVGGTWIAKPDAIAGKRWDQIKDNTRIAVGKIT